jgi:WD40 repeat protein
MWLQNGRTLVSAAQSIRFWDIETGRQTNVLDGYKDSVTCVSLSADGRLLALKGSKGTVQLWRCDTWERVAVLNEQTGNYLLDTVAFHPVEPVLATLSEKNTDIRIWDLDLDVLLSTAQMNA